MGGSMSSSSTSSSSSGRGRGRGGGGGGGATASSITATDRAMLDLKNARDRLSKYKTKLEKDDERLVQRAKQAKLEGQTKNALLLLKVRKIKQREVDTVESQLLNVLQMVQTLDSKQNEKEVLDAMAVGKDTLKKMHEEMSVDDVLELMDEISEQHELEREVNAAFGQHADDISSSVLSVEDEEAIEAELLALMGGGSGDKEEKENESEEPAGGLDLPTAPDTKPLPQVPTTKLPEHTAVATSTEQEQERVAVPS
mmetsp:Transcript_29062/g.70107  ORF Transcript_29062/g.70107 Transcript_29062/m.70107 type:complete len:255 (-) Transcript_29062:66-830(-)|eukprot:CAMPEP_0113499700 /NCGR_PEP_ID=MMETSP0014_2-20120614/31893_1 /TAXON_ID=2857 /ORGANISM="Nitzschia sp." /LENGTH=254 /DNA_ID=CAMNT_0000393903 /DNA_START=51 /DNA_END=815 /DNA_ORIENTATION=- /assembly_acc=CAM_ASM_000159